MQYFWHSKFYVKFVPWIWLEHTCISSPFFTSFQLSSHISDTKFFRSSGPVHSPLQFHSFIFIPFLRLTPVHVETQYGSATSQNSIENRVRQCIRVYSIRRDKVNKPEGTEKQKRILRSREPFAIQKILVYR